MERALETQEYKGMTIELHHDDSGSGDPKEYSTLGTMVCAHKRYTLGHEQINESDFVGWDEVRDHLVKKRGAQVILPIYMMDHSGVALSVRDYNDQWDSGMVGFIFADSAKLKEHFGSKSISDEQKKQAREILAQEVKLYGQWVNGEVYGYVIKKDDEEVASCWGFVGDSDYCMSEAREEADSIASAA